MTKYGLRTVTGFLARLRQDERGAAFVMFVGLTVVLFGASAVAVDLSSGFAARSQLQATADAAALAAAKQLPNSTAARATAHDLVTRNMSVSAYGNVAVDADILIGRWNPTTRTFTNNATPPNSVRVTTRRSAANNNAIGVSFAGFLGADRMNVSASATAVYGPGLLPWDVMIVQDVTSSFGVEIADARAGDQVLLNCIRDNTSGTSRVGVTLFTGVGLLHQNFLAIGTGYSTLQTKIGQLRVCGSAGMPACSGTNIAAGLNRGIDTFISNPSATGVKRAIVLVSDGEPNPASLKPAAIAAAGRAHSEGISVFTVFYDRDNSASQRAFLASLIRGEGTAVATQNASQLSTLLSTLCTDNVPMMSGLVG
jgi:Flp pilus assembly protein TadG